jgi:hypothetical protein
MRVLFVLCVLYFVWFEKKLAVHCARGGIESTNNNNNDNRMMMMAAGNECIHI